jgi:hypothetical protein
MEDQLPAAFAQEVEVEADGSVYQPPLPSTTLRETVSWEKKPAKLSWSATAQEWWGHLTEERSGLPQYLLFDGVGRREIVDECLDKLQKLDAGELIGRRNCCILGAKDVGKTCLLKGLVCLNSVLSPNTTSIYVDGKTVKRSLSSLIVEGSRRSRLDRTGATPWGRSWLSSR